MRTFLIASLSLAAAIVPGTAMAQDSSYYSCQNANIPITIPALPLNEALEIFTQATRCPVSRDYKLPARGKRSALMTRRVKGTMAPDVALRRMIAGLPVKSRAIHGGFSIY